MFGFGAILEVFWGWGPPENTSGDRSCQNLSKNM